MSNYLVPQKDDLPIRLFGSWTVEKVDYLKKYISVFETSMRGRPWRQRSYIDLFAGTGKFRIDENGEVYLGSALIALSTEHPFSNYYFCENDPENMAILQTRCQSSGSKINYYSGDANKKVEEIVESILNPDSTSPNQ